MLITLDMHSLLTLSLKSKTTALVIPSTVTENEASPPIDPNVLTVFG